jgi:hypothetical protein
MQHTPSLSLSLSLSLSRRRAWYSLYSHRGHILGRCFCKTCSQASPSYTDMCTKVRALPLPKPRLRRLLHPRVCQHPSTVAQGCLRVRHLNTPFEALLPERGCCGSASCAARAASLLAVWDHLLEAFGSAPRPPAEARLLQQRISFVAIRRAHIGPAGGSTIGVEPL